MIDREFEDDSIEDIEYVLEKWIGMKPPGESRWLDKAIVGLINEKQHRMLDDEGI
jgi:hypothetical protein